MKCYIVQVFTFGTFVGQDGYRCGPYLIHAEVKERAAKYAVRECIANGKLKKDADYTGKVILRPISPKWLASEEPGICPTILEPYGHGFRFQWNPKKDKIVLTEE